jgi:branched-subunit amino acid transport protein
MTWPGPEVWLAIVVIAVGTFTARAGFLWVADRLMALPTDVRIALRMVPAATMAALTLPALLRPGGQWDPLGPRAIAGLVAALVAWRTRSVLATVLVGLAAVAVLEAVMG